MTDKMNIDYWKSLLDERWTEQIKMHHKGKDFDEAVSQSYIHLISDETRMNNSDASDFKRLVNTWMSKTRPAFKKEEVKRFDLTGI